jgi:hypothetical protein
MAPPNDPVTLPETVPARMIGSADMRASLRTREVDRPTAPFC